MPGHLYVISSSLFSFVQSFIRTCLLLITVYNIYTYEQCKFINLLRFRSKTACSLSELLNSGIIIIIMSSLLQCAGTVVVRPITETAHIVD
jgi:hypothetical protein